MLPFRSSSVLWFTLSLGLMLVPLPALAGNTSGATRTQSGLPSVYRQNWPGHSPYPQYPGTGPNTPCGLAPAPPAPGGSRPPANSAGGPVCVPSPPGATGVRSMRDLARVVMSGYGAFGGRHYPIFIARVVPPSSYDWLVTLTGIDADARSNGEHEVNTWATANGTLAPFQMVGHSLGGIAEESLLFYAATLQISDLPRSRIITLGSPIVTFPRLLAPNTTIDRFPGTEVRYFAAYNDLAVIGPAAFPLRFQHPPVASDPPLFNWIRTPGVENPHFGYHISGDMLVFDPFGDRGTNAILRLNPDQQYRCTTASDGSPPRPIPFGVSGPDQQSPNCALVSFETIRADVVRVRGALQTSQQRNQGNVAAAYVNVPGLRCFVSASSQVDSVTGDAERAVGLVGMATGLYDSRPVAVAGTNNPADIRETYKDSENKLLDAVGRAINMNSGARGTIQLFTERPPCPSCDDVIADFGRKQPFITLMVIDNNGAVIKPPQQQ